MLDSFRSRKNRIRIVYFGGAPGSTGGGVGEVGRKGKETSTGDINEPFQRWAADVPSRWGLLGNCTDHASVIPGKEAAVFIY